MLLSSDKRRGRPCKDVKKCRDVKVRLDEDELTKLDILCLKGNRNRSEAIREAIKIHYNLTNFGG